MRPTTLKQVAEQIIAGKDFNFAVKEFIDEIRHMRANYIDVGSSYIQEPAMTGTALYDVFLAGLAEMISHTRSVGKPPKWAMKQERFLDEPFVFGGRHSRDMMLQYTPIEMRNRLLFCGEIKVF